MRGLTHQTAADMWGVGRSTITHAVRDGHIEKRKDGSIDSASLKKWGMEYQARLKEKEGVPDSGSNGAGLGIDPIPGDEGALSRSECERRLAYWKSVKMHKDALKADDELRKARSELVPAEEVEARYADIYARLKAHVASAFAKVPVTLGLPQSERDEARTKLRKLERQLLEAVAAPDDEEDETNPGDEDD